MDAGVEGSICGTHEGARQWCNNRDNPGTVMSSILWVLTLYSDIVVIYMCAAGKWAVFNAPLYLFLSIMALTCHVKVPKSFSTHTRNANTRPRNRPC